MDDKLYWYKATLIRAVDGDTAEIDLDLGMDIHFRERVRIYGINTPEIFGVKKESNEYAKGMEAKRAVEELLGDREFWVKTHKDKKGKYGRYIVEIFFDPEDDLGPVSLDENGLISLGQYLVSKGLAEYKEY
jgi:micrococcal nuclease